jgi:hypothetical protein
LPRYARPPGIPLKRKWLSTLRFDSCPLFFVRRSLFVVLCSSFFVRRWLRGFAAARSIMGGREGIRADHHPGAWPGHSCSAHPTRKGRETVFPPPVTPITWLGVPDHLPGFTKSDPGNAKSDLGIVKSDPGNAKSDL